MRYLFGTLLLLFVAVSTALIAVRDPGYVLITRDPWVFETSLAVFVPLLAVVFVALYYGVRLVSRLWHSPRDLMRWRQARRTRRAREAFLEGLTGLAAGDWYQAEKSLLAGMRGADSPFLALLAMAIAAHGQNDHDKRNRYLTQAREQGGPHAQAALLLQARLLVTGDELPAAQSALAELQADRTVHAETTRLLAAVLYRLHDWTTLAHVLVDIRRHSWLPEPELSRLELDTHSALLGLELPAGARPALDAAWQAVPRHLREHPRIVAAYARQLLRQNAVTDCIKEIETALDRHWYDELVEIYGLAAGPNPEEQLEVAEEWHARHGDSAPLYLTLGRLARRARLLDRARPYLQKSIDVEASADAHEELGGLLAELGETAQALEHCRLALQSCRTKDARSYAPPAGASSDG